MRREDVSMCFGYRAFKCVVRGNRVDGNRHRFARVAQGRTLAKICQKALSAHRAFGFLVSRESPKFAAFPALAILFLAGCSSPPDRVLPKVAPFYATLPNGYEPLNPTKPSPIYADVTAIP